MSRDVVVLGAGFSRAINACMPDANTLGQQACCVARKHYPAFFQRRRFSPQAPFEIWLSQLADDLPYLTERENRQNKAYFVTLSDAIGKVVIKMQQQALGRPPEWLFKLLSVWHERQAVVITLNYDTLIESGVESHYLQLTRDRLFLPVLKATASRGREAERDKVHASDILGGEPPASDGSDMELVPSFKLLKLHGSVDWWLPYGATVPARLGRLPRFGVTPPSQPGPPQVPGADARFIVPPLATKTAYYTLPFARRLWQDAHDAIAQAQTLTIIGYSLPVTDFVFTGMLASALRAGQNNVTVDVVDLQPDAVAQRLRALGTRQVATFNGRDCVARYTEATCRQAMAEVLRTVTNSNQAVTHPGSVIVRWCGSSAGTPKLEAVNVAKVERRGASAVLVLDPARHNVLKPCEGDPTILSVRDELRGATSLTARAGPRQYLPIVGLREPDYTDKNRYQPLYLIAAGTSGELPSDNH